MEIVKYSIRKNEMMASVTCICAERQGAPYADAQYWGRYGYGRYYSTTELALVLEDEEDLIYQRTLFPQVVACD